MKISCLSRFIDMNNRPATNTGYRPCAPLLITGILTEQHSAKYFYLELSYFIRFSKCVSKSYFTTNVRQYMYILVTSFSTYMMLIILLNKQSDFTTTTHSQDSKLYKDIHTDKQCIRRIH